MDKTKIEFLIRNGFSLDEIMKLEPETQESEQKQEEKNPAPSAPVETKSEESNNFEKMLADFKKELSDMREEMHKQNRTQSFTEPKQPEQLSFEEDIEKMIEEVTK